MDAASKTGKVKVVKLFPQCFGFIIADDGSGDVFFHRSKTRPPESFEDLKPGDIVRFGIGEGRRGPMAVNVRRVSVDNENRGEN